MLDPKHTSNATKKFYDDKNIIWWKSPAESPDINPIENLWHELKEHLRKNVKPKNDRQLRRGIKSFWRTVDKKTCCKYINHLYKVIPRVSELNGLPTGY